MENRFCKKCLMNEVMGQAEYKHMQDYISNIDSFIKAEEKDYKERLGICMDCDNLINGMCKLCGCYVEMRAAVKKNYCPNIERKWDKIS